MLFATEKLEIFYIFGQKNRSNFRKGSSFVRFAPSEAKKNSRIFGEMPTFIKSGRDPLLKNLQPPPKKKSLVWAWLKPVKCIGLGSRVGGGLRGLSPLNILSGAGVSFSPQKSYILITID